MSLIEGILRCRRGRDSGCQLTDTITSSVMMCTVVGVARAVNGWAECLADQMLADVLGFECGATIRGSCSLFIYYTHVNSILEEGFVRAIRKRC